MLVSFHYSPFRGLSSSFWMDFYNTFPCHLGILIEMNWNLSVLFGGSVISIILKNIFYSGILFVFNLFKTILCISVKYKIFLHQMLPFFLHLLLDISYICWFFCRTLCGVCIWMCVYNTCVLYLSTNILIAFLEFFFCFLSSNKHIIHFFFLLYDIDYIFKSIMYKH